MPVSRREHLAEKTDHELHEVAAMERIVPLDYEIAALAEEILRERSQSSERPPDTQAGGAGNAESHGKAGR